MKRLRKDAKDIMGSSLFMGIGSSVITSAGGSAAPMASMSRFMPVHGKLAGARSVFRVLRKL